MAVGTRAKCILNPFFEQTGILGSMWVARHLLDGAEHLTGVVGERCVALPLEGLLGLGGSSADEVGERLGELGPLVVHLRGEAQREDPLDHDVGDGRQTAGQRPPHLDDGAQVGVASVPRAVQ